MTPTTLAGWPAFLLTDGDATATVVPGRGGLVADWTVGGLPQLWLDEATLGDPSRSVRGGIPLLFPTPGKRRDDRWAFGGRSGFLPQHGFARTLPWEVVGEDGGLQMRLVREGDAAWPWPLTVELDVSLSGSTLRLDHRVVNRADEPFPFGFGFHPYFLVPDAQKSQARVRTDATLAWNKVTKQTVAIDGPLDLTAAEVDLHLLDHQGTVTAPTRSCLFETPGRRIEIGASAAYVHWVAWTLRGKDFVCVEPWTCAEDAMETGERSIVLEPGAVSRLWVELRALPWPGSAARLELPQTALDGPDSERSSSG